MEKRTNKDLVEKLTEVSKFAKGMDSLSSAECDDKLIVAFGGTIYLVSVQEVGHSFVDDMKDFKELLTPVEEPVLC